MCGHSAGGHLSMMVAASPWFASLSASDRALFAAFVPIAGVFDLPPLLYTSVNEGVKMSAAEAVAASPAAEDNVERVRAAGMAVVVVQAEFEAEGLVQQGNDYSKVII